MNIIKQIYQSRISETIEVLSSRELDNRIYQMIERENIEEKEYLSDLFFEAGNYGQEDGFIVGFRLAVALMVECLGKWRLLHKV